MTGLWRLCERRWREMSARPVAAPERRGDERGPGRRREVVAGEVLDEHDGGCVTGAGEKCQRARSLRRSEEGTIGVWVSVVMSLPRMSSMNSMAVTYSIPRQIWRPSTSGRKSDVLWLTTY